MVYFHIFWNLHCSPGLAVFFTAASPAVLLVPNIYEWNTDLLFSSARDSQDGIFHRTISAKWNPQWSYILIHYNSTHMTHQQVRRPEIAMFTCAKHCIMSGVIRGDNCIAIHSVYSGVHNNQSSFSCDKWNDSQVLSAALLVGRILEWLLGPLRLSDLISKPLCQPCFMLWEGNSAASEGPPVQSGSHYSVQGQRNRVDELHLLRAE